MFAKSTHQSMSGILERLESLEMEMQDLRKPKDVPKVLNPMGYQVEDAEEL
jgi:hypothetical protein